ncbi:cation:proton antiporter [Spirulina subsalsa FACHB-351]|uniref:Cation:proton antiporter n=1 Tax=Spirulina subsalsa FACHB-351 TaxID=234711 RepID=A0ABT3LBW3_9CYAN|nr:cation:proton antiporter [Spirulina subsalsa]MCW6039005.1 cation:proton antiporter [Spirulina subsalsa FACHB-351]
MNVSTLLTPPLLWLGLLLLATVVAMVCRWLPLGFRVLFLAVGLGLGMLTPGPIPPGFTPHLLLWLCLPALLFQGAFTLNASFFRQYRFPTLIWAILGFLLSTCLFGVILAQLTGLNLTPALVLGGLVTATDPTGLLERLKRLDTPHQVQTVAQGEGLYNQLTLILLLPLLLRGEGFEALTGAEWMGLGQVLVLGIAGGSLGGVLLTVLLLWTKEQPWTMALLSLFLVYGGYTLWELGGTGAGALGVVSAGLVTQQGLAHNLAPSHRAYLHSLWDYGGNLARAGVTLVLGWRVVQGWSGGADLMLLWVGGGAVVLTLLLRPLLLWGFFAGLNKIRDLSAIAFPQQTLLITTGLPSSVGFLLALNLPPTLEQRDVILLLLIGVSLVRFLLFPPLLGWVIRQQELQSPRLLKQVEKAQALLTSQRAALNQIPLLKQISALDPAVIQHFTQNYNEGVYQGSQALESLWGDRRHVLQIPETLWLYTLTLERAGYQQLYEGGLLSEFALDKLELRILLKHDAIQAGFIPPPFFSVRPSETPWQRWLYRVLGWLIFRPQLLQNHRQTVADAKYEADLAIAHVCAQIAQTLRQLQAETDLRADLVERCANTYQEDSVIATQQLETVAKYTPHLARQRQQSLIERVTRLSELETLYLLEQEGILRSPLAVLLRQQIARRNRQNLTRRES